MENYKKIDGNPFNSFNSVSRDSDITAKSQTPIEIATRPFSASGEKSHDIPIANALGEIFKKGSAQEIGYASLTLLKSCENDDLPESTRDFAKELLVRFLIKMLPPDETFLPFNVDETDQLIAHFLKKLLFLEVEKVVSSTRDRNSYDGNLATDDQDIKFSIEKIQQIYFYLHDKPDYIDDQFLCDFSENLISILNDELATDLKQKVEKRNNDIIVKNELLTLIEKRFSTVIEDQLATIIENQLSTIAEEECSTIIKNTFSKILNSQEAKTSLTKIIEIDLLKYFDKSLDELLKNTQNELDPITAMKFTKIIEDESEAMIKNKRFELLKIIENELTTIIQSKLQQPNDNEVSRQ